MPGRTRQDWLKTSWITPTFQYCHGRDVYRISVQLLDHLDHRPVSPAVGIVPPWWMATHHPNTIRRLTTPVHQRLLASLHAQGGHTPHWHGFQTCDVTICPYLIWDRFMKCSFYHPTHLYILLLMIVQDWLSWFFVHMLLKGLATWIYHSDISVLYCFYSMSFQKRCIVSFGR